MWHSLAQTRYRFWLWLHNWIYGRMMRAWTHYLAVDSKFKANDAL